MPLSRTSPNNFSSLNMQDLVDFFGLKTKSLLDFASCPVLDLQLPKIIEITTVSSQEIDTWNEQELIIKHISLILNTAKMEGEDYNTFAERSLSGTIDEIEFCGIVDFLVARGKFEPREPYFFIQEYKRNKLGPNSDPLAQLLGEMMVTQKINQNSLVYGAYIVGRLWYFVILENRNYNVLQPLDSTNLEELTQIIGKLNWVKKYVEEKLSGR